MTTGRPSVLAEEKKSVACALARVGLSRRAIAQQLGCAASTIRYALANDEAFARDFRESEASVEFHFMAHLHRNAERSWRASAWALERIAPDRYGTGRERLEAIKVRMLREMRAVMEQLKAHKGKGEQKQRDTQTRNGGAQ